MTYWREMQGRASGRPSPRTPLRMPAREHTLMTHGLLSPGDADVRQGQLFDSQPYTRSVEDTAYRANVTSPLEGSRGGFLPEIHGNTRYSAHERKMAAIENFAAMRRSTNSDEVHQAQGAAHMRHMAGLRAQAQDSNWYSDRQAGEGESVRLLRTTGEAQGMDLNSLTRATAVTSPQMGWDTGSRLYRRYPNIDAAVKVGHDVTSQIRASQRHQFSEQEIMDMGERSRSQALGLGKQRAALAFVAPDETRRDIPADENYQKVLNFNESLMVGRQDLPTSTRAAYAGSYTQDSHDLAAARLPENLHQRLGTYAVAKMLNSRVAFKGGELPPNFQASVWMGQRPPEPLTSSVEDPEGSGKYHKRPSLFYEDQAGRLQAHDFYERSLPKPPDRRSEVARRLGLEF